MSLVSVADYEAEAAKKLKNKPVYEYYRSGAANEFSLRWNQLAFNRIRLRPRVFHKISKVDLSCSIIGLDLSMPISVAPFALQRLAHPDGEVATARAAGKAGVIFSLPTTSTTSIEDIGKEVPDTMKWMQLFIYRDRDLSKAMIERAERAGFKAIVITVDCAVSGVKRGLMKNKFEFPLELALTNFTGKHTKHTGNKAFYEYGTSPCSVDDVKFVKRTTKLPVIIKGIYTAEDAIIAADLGVDAIIVSNHGARQLDTCTATIEALPEVVRAVGHRVPIILDSGVRQGTDIFKALALGAKMVLVGRPVLWGLTVDGQTGVEHILEILKMELENAMILTGCAKLSDITKDMVAHESQYHKL